MTREEWIEKQIAEYEARVGQLPAHNKNVLRQIMAKEHDFWEREAVREGNHTNPVEGDYEPTEDCLWR